MRRAGRDREEDSLLLVRAHGTVIRELKETRAGARLRGEDAALLEMLQTIQQRLVG